MLMSERARPVLEPDALPVLDEPVELVPLVPDMLLPDVVELLPLVLPLLLSMFDVPVVLGDVLVVGVLVLLGCESSTSPPDVLVVPRCMLALPDDGTQLLDMLMLPLVLRLVLGVVPVPFAPFVVFSPVNR